MYIKDIACDMYFAPDGLYCAPDSASDLVKLNDIGIKCCLKSYVKKEWKHLGSVNK